MEILRTATPFGSLVICSIRCVPILPGRKLTEMVGSLTRRQSPDLCYSLNGHGDESWWPFRENIIKSVFFASSVAPSGERECNHKSSSLRPRGMNQEV